MRLKNQKKISYQIQIIFFISDQHRISLGIMVHFLESYILSKILQLARPEHVFKHHKDISHFLLKEYFKNQNHSNLKELIEMVYISQIYSIEVMEHPLNHPLSYEEYIEIQVSLHKV